MASNVQFENEWHAPREDSGQSSRMTRFVMRQFGIKSAHAANIALAIFALCAFFLSLYIFFAF